MVLIVLFSLPGKFHWESVGHWLGLRLRLLCGFCYAFARSSPKSAPTRGSSSLADQDNGGSGTAWTLRRAAVTATPSSPLPGGGGAVTTGAFPNPPSQAHLPRKTGCFLSGAMTHAASSFGGFHVACPFVWICGWRLADQRTQRVFYQWRSYFDSWATFSAYRPPSQLTSWFYLDGLSHFPDTAETFEAVTHGGGPPLPLKRGNSALFRGLASRLACLLVASLLLCKYV